ncbi:MAG: hypothetical protein HY314_15475 [Acidobacteria bacterium]|nr:hypothetical protein [Acidobacteriota bacterium]
MKITKGLLLLAVGIGALSLLHYELANHFNIVKVVVITINIAVVWYLIARLREREWASEALSIPDIPDGPPSVR